MICYSMISFKQDFDVSMLQGLMKNLPQDVLKQLAHTLNEEGPCNWRAFYQILVKKSISFR